MKQKQLKQIPKFASEAVEQAFWASHDSTENVDWSQAKPAFFPDLQRSTESISIRLPKSLLVQLKVLARRMDVPYQSLMKMYLRDRVRQEL